MLSCNVYLCERFLVVREKAGELVYSLYGHDKGIIKVCVAVCVLIFKLDSALAFSTLEAVARDRHNGLVIDLKESAVEDCSLVIGRHSEGHLTDHLFEHRLTHDKATVTHEVGDRGEISTCKRAHSVRGAAGADASDHLTINREGYFIITHYLDRLIELLCIYNKASLFYYLSLDCYSDALFKIVGCESHGVGHFCLY